MKAIIENGRYYDKNGIEIHDGDKIKWDNGKVEEVYLTEENELGTDATNPVWIAKGKACPCEFGIYPLTEADMTEIEKC